MKWVLGISVDRNPEVGVTVIHQRKYINDMVVRFGQQNAAPIGLPYAGGDERQPKEVTAYWGLQPQRSQSLQVYNWQPTLCSRRHST